MLILKQHLHISVTLISSCLPPQIQLKRDTEMNESGRKRVAQCISVQINRPITACREALLQGFIATQENNIIQKNKDKGEAIILTSVYMIIELNMAFARANEKERAYCKSVFSVFFWV